jgi:hypothetical protein
MKVTVYDWAMGSNLEARTKYKHNQEIDADKTFEVAKEIFDSGLNVMLFRLEGNTIIAVDTKRFQQR